MDTRGAHVGSIIEAYVEGLRPSHGDDEARAIMRAVFAEVMHWDAHQLEMRGSEQLAASVHQQFVTILDRLLHGEPLQYITGRVRFHGLDLTVGPGVLIPRPETEEMVDMIIKSGIQPKRIVDIGTGSGCIAFALKQAFPNAHVTGVDISKEAIAIAVQNKRSTGLEVELVVLDILNEDLKFPAGTDLVVSNPPYVPEGERPSLAEHVKGAEPHIALFVPDADPLLFYKRIADLAFRDLIPSGSLWFEGHRVYSFAVGILLSEIGFGHVNVAQDMSGAPRFISAKR